MDLQGITWNEFSNVNMIGENFNKWIGGPFLKGPTFASRPVQLYSTSQGMLDPNAG